MICAASDCRQAAVYRVRFRIVGCVGEVCLCQGHGLRWIVAASSHLLVAEFDPVLYSLDDPHQAKPSDTPGQSSSCDMPDQRQSRPRQWTLTCEQCGLPIVRHNDIWAAVLAPGQFHNEEDAHRFQSLATNHEHRPG